MNDPSTPTPKHIPAWRRLGLKLKHAKEPLAAARGADNGIADESRSNLKRKIPAVVEASETASTGSGCLIKKKKTTSTSPDNNGTTSVLPSAEATKLKSLSPATTSSQKKKSVTFAPETKAEDGESLKQYYKKWLSSQQTSDPDFDADKLSPALRSIEPAAARVTTPEESAAALTNTSPPTEGKPIAPKKKKQKKKQKKSKSTSGSSNSLQTPSSATDGSSSAYVHPALVYLTTHHTSRSTWKFNKAHQNYILKHTFHHTHIPPVYDPALALYLKGLASENTKARIRREAIEIRAEDEKWLATPEPDPETADKNSNVQELNGDSDMGVERETLEQNLARRLRDYNAAVDKMKAILEAKEEDREAAEWHLGPARKEWEARLERRRRAEVALWGVGEIGQTVMEALQMAVEQQQQWKPTTGKVTEQPEFRTQMGPKRIKFGEEDEVNGRVNGRRTDSSVATTHTPTTTTTTTTTSSSSGGGGGGGGSGDSKTSSTKEPNPPAADSKKKRKRKRTVKDRQGAIPDDLTSSSSSSSGDSDKGDDASEDEETKRVMQRKADLEERLAAQKRELERAKREVEEEMSDETSGSSEDDGASESEEGGGSGGESGHEDKGGSGDEESK